MATYKLKVFLLDFADFRAPASFTRSWVQDLIFGKKRPNALADGTQPESSIAQYFEKMTDGKLELTGTVVDWAKSGYKLSDIPHYHDSMGVPDVNGNTFRSCLGEMCLTQALKINNLTEKNPIYVTNNVVDRNKLLADIKRLPDNTMADGIAILFCSFFWSGGVRGPGSLLEGFNLISGANITNRIDPKINKPWNTHWEQTYNLVPSIAFTTIAMPAKNQRSNRILNPNGSQTIVNASLSINTVIPLSVVTHELSHLCAGLPDEYGADYQKWFQFDNMGESVESIFPPPVTAYTRNLGGWMGFSETDLTSKPLLLRPLETHNQAWRLMNGLPGSNEFLVLENREELSYGDTHTKPTLKGRMLYVYRHDPHRRLNRMVIGKGQTIGQVVSVVRKKAAFGEVWRHQQSLPLVPATGDIDTYPPTCRNSRGELWWNLENINVSANGGSLTTEAKCFALDLISDFASATWTTTNGRVLTPDLFADEDAAVWITSAGPVSHNLYITQKLMIRGAVTSGSNVNGRYLLPVALQLGGSYRFYSRFKLSHKSTDGVRITLNMPGAQGTFFTLSPGQELSLTHDFRLSSNATEFNITVNGLSNPGGDLLEISNAWLVPLSKPLFDFIGNSNQATWTSAAGALTLGTNHQEKGEVSHRTNTLLHNGRVHSSQNLFTHPNWTATGFVQGVYPNVSFPFSGAVLRAQADWFAGRTVQDSGAFVDILFKPTGAPAAQAPVAVASNLHISSFVVNAPVNDRELSCFEIPINGTKLGMAQPAGGVNANISGTFTIKVKANATDFAGNSSQDWVTWVNLGLFNA